MTSTADPQVRIEVPVRAAYVGSDAWVLYGIADCRQFVYAEPGSSNIVKRLYWIQFESYLPSLSKLRHQYASKRHARLGGLDFYVDTWTEDNRKPNAHAEDLAPLEAFLRSKGYAVPPGISSGSDERHVDALLAAKGFRLPAVTASVRFVHLADAKERKELMIIYSEDAGAGAAPEELVRRAAEVVRVSQ
ncbi:MAG TPA: hypothetical protein VGI15_05415 [Candidatus Cybelea sp.]